jgi:cytochrome P450
VTGNSHKSDRIDFCDLESRRDPYPLYARLRTNAPVHRSSLGFWLVLDYRNCAAILKDSKRWSADSRNALSAECFEEPSPAFGGNALVCPHLFWAPPRLGDVRPFMFLDDPDHRRIRSLGAQAFTRSAVRSYEARIEELAAELLDRALGKHEADLIAEFAYRLPMTVICELLGVPLRDQAAFRRLSRRLGHTLTPDYLLTAREREASREALIVVVKYLMKLAAERKQQLGDDLLSALLIAEESGQQLSPEEVIATVMILLIAGHETTVNAIANGTLALLAHPAQARALARDRSLARGAVDEVLRFDAPVQVAARTAFEDVEVGGHTIAAGEHVLAMMAAANRDPDVFEDPDRFDVRRENASRHLAFGSGVHTCIGAQLARTEAEIALHAIARHLDTLELAAPVEYRRDAVLRGPEALLVRPGVRSRRVRKPTRTVAVRHAERELSGSKEPSR